MSWYRRERGTLVVSVHAQPGAKRTEVAGLHGEALKVRVAAPALEDRANAVLTEFLADAFAVPRRCVRLLSGAKSRAKRFAIDADVNPQRLLEG